MLLLSVLGLTQLALTWWGSAAFLSYSDLSWAQGGWAASLSYY
jgi:hypothetical protein